MIDVVSAKIHESVKEDYKAEVESLRIENREYKYFIAEIAKAIGENQEIPKLKASIYLLVANDSKLRDIKDNRPLTRHPFEGVGKIVKNILSKIEIIVSNYSKDNIKEVKKSSKAVVSKSH